MECRLPAVVVQRAVLDGSDGVLPLVAVLQRFALDDAAAGEAQHAGVHVVERLSEVAAHAVLAVLERVDGEKAHVLESHAACAAEQHAQTALLCGLAGREHSFVLLPLAAAHLYLRLGALLRFVLRALVGKRDVDCSVAVQRSCPYREAVRLVFDESDAEVALVLQTRSALLMPREAEHYVVGAALEGSVRLHLHVAERLPSEQRLRKLERTVLYKLAVQSAVGSIVDVLEEDAVHGGAYRCASLTGVDVERVRLGEGAEYRRCSQHARKDISVSHLS